MGETRGNHAAGGPQRVREIRAAPLHVGTALARQRHGYVQRPLLPHAQPSVSGTPRTFLSQRYQAQDPDGVLDRLGLLPGLRRRSRSLSVGERRRAELGLAILSQPVCLLADEPFRELSPKDSEVVGRALRDLAAAGCGVVVTGHEVSTLFDVAEHVIWMTAGTTREIGTPEQARAHPEFRCEYLERPRP